MKTILIIITISAFVALAIVRSLLEFRKTELVKKHHGFGRFASRNARYDATVINWAEAASEPGFVEEWRMSISYLRAVYIALFIFAASSGILLWWYY